MKKMDKNDFILCLAIAIIVILLIAVLIAVLICSRDAEGIKGVKIFPMPIGGKIIPIIL